MNQTKIIKLKNIRTSPVIHLRKSMNQKRNAIKIAKISLTVSKLSWFQFVQKQKISIEEAAEMFDKVAKYFKQKRNSKF